jgi:hypothetical protein
MALDGGHHPRLAGVSEGLSLQEPGRGVPSTTCASATIHAFIQNNVRDAKASNLALIMSVNLLSGGGKDEGLPGYHSSKYALNASQLRAGETRSWTNPISVRS